ncbi:MAG TPA: hypothetical protein VNX68_08850 [Nitrosopumilaceae archaeon]|jgi:hypothetical protein|nr:hypothetical protein [Nitrosopumilaceae archaeon]
MKSRIQELPIIGYYDKQRFTQFNPSDCANWTLQPSELGKKGYALYPAMGRRHISFLGINQLIFSAEPRYLFKTNNFWYAVVVNAIYRIDKNYDVIEITEGKVTTFNGLILADFLVASQLQNQPSITYVGFVDGQHIYIYREETNSFDIITDPNAPPNPTYIAAFGNRFVVAGGNTSQFNLSEINLGGSAFNPATAWTISSQAVFAQASNIINGFAVLKNILYIFTPFTTEPWANNPSQLLSVGGTVTSFPWRQNSSYNFDFGLSDVQSLDVGFGMMSWVGENRAGLKQILMSDGSAPKPIATDAIEVLFQKLTTDGTLSTFLTGPLNGFLFSYENNIFYRLTSGTYSNTGLIDAEDLGNAIECNFNTKSWKRVVEKNGQRNRIQKHIFFNNVHYVTVVGDKTIYQMSGHFYDNEITNPASTDPQSLDAYLVEPFRYELVTKIIFEKEDYSEFETEYVEIDFVWGLETFIRSTGPFENAIFVIDESPGTDGNPQFIIDENPGPDGQPVYVLSEQGNFPVASDLIYNNWFKPHIELYWSDNGAVSFHPADVLEFSQLGVYEWRMRWYQLGPSRNRSYKLICYSPSPIVVLGGDMLTRRISGGAN